MILHELVHAFPICVNSITNYFKKYLGIPGKHLISFLINRQNSFAANTLEFKSRHFFAHFFIKGLKFIFGLLPADGARQIGRVAEVGLLTPQTRHMLTLAAHYRVIREAKAERANEVLD